MKRLLLTIVLLIMASVILSSCIPQEPQDVLPFCQELYEDLLSGDPDFPHVFIGYCVATIQTGETRAAQGLCRYEGLWDDIGVSSRKECVEYLEALN